MVVVKIVAICAQSVFLVVSRVTRNLFIGMDGLDVGANSVLFCHGGRGGTIGRVGRGFVGRRIVGRHVGYGGGEALERCSQRLESRRLVAQRGKQWFKAPDQEEGREGSIV